MALNNSLNIQPLLKKKDVLRILGISTFALADRIKKDPSFPRPVKFGEAKQAAVYFKPHELQAYIDGHQQAK